MRVLTRGWLLGMLIGWPAMALAQGGEPPSLRRNHVTIAGGVTWSGGYAIGGATAELRGNGVGASAPPFVLFRVDSAIEGAAAAEARVEYALARALSIEVGFSFSRPRISTDLSQDAEAAAMTIDAERLNQYIVAVGATWQLPRPVVAGRLRPYVAGGGGYLRQLYQERTLVKAGQVYYAGGGVRYWLRGGDGRRRSLGLRGEARAVWRRDGVDFDSRTRVAPSAAVHLFAEL